MIGKKIIDLTMPLNGDVCGVSIEQSKTLIKEGWNATTLHLYSHSGTHMDAPVHFGVNEQTVDQLSVNRLISEAWIVDLRPVEPNQLIEVHHLSAIVDDFVEGQSILLHTGWSHKLGTDDYRDRLPRISKELALWMGAKGVNLLGVEPPSVADVNNLPEVTEIHKILMENDVIIVEGLCNLDAIFQKKIILVALPLKVENGDGAPARVIAIEN